MLVKQLNSNTEPTVFAKLYYTVNDIPYESSENTTKTDATKIKTALIKKAQKRFKDTIVITNFSLEY